uniref:DUF4220 domain-containing protein n=1 Tax=Oryza brachyantha TaxID=4533 RepID=J3LVI9_ORYBR
MPCKARVISSWTGYCIRVISPLVTAGSLLVFHFNGKDGQNIVDIAISYVLLGGAFLLEVTSLLGALSSSWTFPFLCATRWKWLRHVALCRGRWQLFRRKIVSLRHLFKVMGISTPSRRWSGSMGQYNMLHFCSRRGTSCNLLGFLAKMVGLEDRWEMFHYSGTLEVPNKDEVNTLGVIRKNWGEQTLKHWKDLDQVITEQYLGAELQECIIIWHIATELVVVRSSRAKDHDAAPEVEAARALSNYMMLLLVSRPDMLPGLPQNRLYQRSINHLVQIWREAKVEDPTHRHPGENVWIMLMEQFRLRDNPNSDSWRPQREKLACYLLDEEIPYAHETSRTSYAIDLAKLLLKKESEGYFTNKIDPDPHCVFQMILEMWIDNLVYAANRCSRESHAKKLN